MKAFIPSREPAGEPPGSVAASPVTSAEDEPVPSAGYRATAPLDVRGLRIAGSTRTDAPALATGISLSVGRGEVLGLVGAAGSGMREIALAIAGRLPAPAVIAAGSILIDGAELVGASRRALHRLHGTKISLVSASEPTALSPGHTIGHQLARSLRRKRGLSRADADRRALELLELVGLPDPLGASRRYAAQLDPTALLQVTLAAAVSHHLDLLILDEPKRALDPAGEPSALELCRVFRREFGLSIIVASRDLDGVAAFCDRVAVVSGGRVVEQGSMVEILAFPQHPHTRTLLDAARAARAARD